MTSDNWQKVKEIFNAALDLDADQRAAYLDSACNDDFRLRRQVDDLLANYRTGFLESEHDQTVKNENADEQRKMKPGDKLKHYEILSLVGVGGMGEVYLAHDSQLGRKVAIKFLNARYESNASNIERFIQEAKAASALNHPNILTIHEIGEGGGSHYIVSEYVDGHRLRTIMEKKGLELSKVLNISIQVAEALSAAHSARIVHRDIKPENIVVRTDGYAKVLDFGLAKLLPEPASFLGLEDVTIKQNQTAKGLILGTVSYMSPEQAKGEPIDQRTDIFSLGVLLYEMVAGRTPFGATSTSETFANLINREPVPMSHYVQGVPDELQRIVSKTLQKDPDRRYQTMKGLLADLKELNSRIAFGNKVDRPTGAEPEARTDILLHATGDDMSRATVESSSGTKKYSTTPTFAVMISAIIFIAIAVAVWYLRPIPSVAVPQIRSLAVLPLKSLDSGENYLGLGIADTVIRKISQTGQVIVRPTSAVKRYLTEETDAIAAAKQLNTDAVLEGNVQRDNDRLRVSVNLLRTSDGASLWTDSFDTHSGDIFAIQDAVAQQVVSRLRLKLDMEQSARLNKHVTANPIAYDYYLRAMYSFDQRSWGPTAKPQVEATAELFKNAIAADPNFALAHAQLANVYAFTGTQIEPENASWNDRAREEIDRADSLDPNLAETHIARMILLTGARSGYQWEAGIREALAAQQIDPNIGHINLADAYYHIGLERQAEREFDRALEIDPTSQWTQNEYVLFFLNYRRYDEMNAAAKKYYPDEPPFSDYFLAKGQLDEALKGFDKDIKDYPDNPWVYAGKAITLEKKGDHGGAEASLNDAIKLLRPLELPYHHMTYQIACVYAVMGKKDEAMKWLRETAATGYLVYPVFARDVFLDSIRKDPEFMQFMTEMKSLNDKYESEFP